MRFKIKTAKGVLFVSLKIFEYDSYLKPYESDIQLRMRNYKNKKKELLKKGEKLIVLC